MEKGLEVLGMSIIVSKYIGLILFAGITISTGAIAADVMMYGGVTTSE
ncbi:MAG: hypothetical protein JKY55_00875 [Aliivibrio sp.]|nr:hypothetical protein [Aliivibrio sp.]